MYLQLYHLEQTL